MKVEIPQTPSADALLAAGARAITSLAPAVIGLEDCPAERQDARRAAQRGYFTPAEDDCVHLWFARYLTARAGLLETIDDLGPIATGAVEVDEPTRIRAFAVAYTAACLAVRAARLLVYDFATDKIVQRKLNEAEPRYRIPRRQYTAVYRSLTKPAHAWRLYQARQFAESHRATLDAMAGDPVLGPVLEHLGRAEESLEVPMRRYLKARLRFRWYSLRRRRASAAQQVLFHVAEACGRVMAGIENPWHAKRIGPDLVGRLAEMLQPGDVLVTHRDQALTNLVLPGYWSHAALHLGPSSVRQTLGIEVDADRAARWDGPVCVLEARKDGVRFRELADTLGVDAVAVIRPTLGREDLARALTQAITHEGKLYNFDFDFFRADRLVCTEVVYRAYDGVGGVRFELTSRAGRLTLAAQDLLEMALEGRGFEPVAVFGAPSCPRALVTGPDAAAALAATCTTT